MLVENGGSVQVVHKASLQVMAMEGARNPNVKYEGPTPCPDCSMPIVIGGLGEAIVCFEIPQGQIYPNTQFPLHLCRGGVIGRDSIFGEL